MDDDVIKTTIGQWIEYHFRLANEEPLPKPDNPDESYDWEQDPKIEVGYIERFFALPEHYTRPYTDSQINNALWIIINETESTMYTLFNENVSVDLRIQAVKNMIHVFEQLFLPRCTANMSAFQDQAHVDKINPLNSICYMWWDIIPFYGKSGNPNREVLDPYCIDVMESTLQLDSIPCQESALHGLGHWKLKYPERIEKIIDAFLARQPDMHPHLREYARVARTGIIL